MTILLAVGAVCVTVALCVRWTLASLEREAAAHRAERAALYQRIQAPEVAVADHSAGQDRPPPPDPVPMDDDAAYWRTRA